MRISDWSSDVCSSDLLKDATVIAEGGIIVHGDAACEISKILNGDEVCAVTAILVPPQGLGIDSINRSEERRVGKECVIRVALGGLRIIKTKTTHPDSQNTHILKTHDL